MAGASRKATSGTTSWEQDGWVFPESEGDVGEGRSRKTKAGGKGRAIEVFGQDHGGLEKISTHAGPS